MARLLSTADGADTRAKVLRTQKDSLLDASPLAVRALRELLRAKNLRVRLDAAKAILDRAGLLPHAESHRDSDANLADVPISELRRIADTLEAEIGTRAKLINATAANKDVESVAIPSE